MPDTNTVARSLHDIGLAAWFGGSLMGDIGLNGAASSADDRTERNTIASDGWARWTPFNLGAIAIHLVGGALITGANTGRIAGQRGVAATSIAKTVLTGAALAATGYARFIGQQQIRRSDAPVEATTTPADDTPDDVAAAQRQQRIVQWSIPALTGALLVVNAWMGEQQRPATVVSGVVNRIVPGR